MVTAADYIGIETAWCPGCGNFGIVNAVKKSLVEMGKEPKDVLLVSGIGQAAKLPHYLRCNVFNGLHGRALPSATGAKIANPNLTVMVTTGDGDCYGEGGNHFINAIRRNIDITLLVHNNEVYGLTKGQASPTSPQGMKTKLQNTGVSLLPINPIALAISLGCGFVARSFSGDAGLTVDLIKQGIAHKGFALIDILQPCPSFNQDKNFAWYRDHTYTLTNHDSSDRIKAFERSLEDKKIPLGVFYHNSFPSFLDYHPDIRDNGLTSSELDARTLYAAMVNEFL